MNQTSGAEPVVGSDARYGHLSLLQTQLHLWQEILFSLLAMFVLITLVYFFNIPNPNMILIAGLVVCSATFGYGGGVTAALVMFLYTLFFFSTENDFITFTPVNTKKVVVSLIGIVVDMVFVCELKSTVLAALRSIGSLTETLQQDNRLLQEASLSDGLTGIRNRLAMRQDFPYYCHKRLLVMMLDIDNFKTINDRFGHDQGDTVLETVGCQLARLFGREHCYRYGGDEFLVLVPELSESAFLAKAQLLVDNMPVISHDASPLRVSCSIGYVYGNATDDDALRAMFAAADERMYQAKSSGKNRIVGDRVL